VTANAQAPYCSVGAITGGDFISLFATTGAVNNVTYTPNSAPIGAYDNQTASNFSSFPGQTISFNYGYNLAANYSAKIWVDWNSDLDFLDAGETIHSAWKQAGVIGNGNFIVPNTLISGTYRMRVQLDEDFNGLDNLMPCANVEYGSTTDFSLVIAAPPTCIAPSAATTSGITAASANLAWTENGTATIWEIEYGITGFTPAEIPTITSNTNPTSLTVLNAVQTYDYYLRASCTSLNKSAWVGPFTFSTLQIPATIPFTDDFSTTQWTAVNGNQINKWVIGSAAGNPANGLYISEDNGVSNTYNINSTSTTKIVRDVQFPVSANDFNLSFDWKANGETTEDYLSVWMIPATATITPGVLITAANTSGAIQIGGNLNQNNVWTTLDFVLSAAIYSGTSKRLVFEWTNNASIGNQGPAAIDNVKMYEITCPSPTAFIATNVTATTAGLSNVKGGVYLIRVFNEGANRTFRIIKN
jgi:hypothetical protein